MISLSLSLSAETCISLFFCILQFELVAQLLRKSATMNRFHSLLQAFGSQAKALFRQPTVSMAASPCLDASPLDLTIALYRVQGVSLWTPRFAVVSQLWTRLLGRLKCQVESILFAVPKKRTTHGKKRRRAATKHLRPMQNITSCSACGQPKLLHHVCAVCFQRYRLLVKKAMEAGQKDF